MGTTSSTSVTSLTAPPTFTGISKFASSLQQVLTRAVGIASLPLNTDQAALTSLKTTQTDLQGLDSVFTNLQQSIASLQTTVSSGLLSASVSDATVSATVGSGASAGTYTVSVNSLGSYSTALSNAGTVKVTDPTTQGLAASPNFTLTTGTTTIGIVAASTSLKDLASAINSQAGGQVQATLVNVGSGGSPDYRLSLQSTSLSTDAIGLTNESGDDLIATSSTGAPASYQIDGLGDPVYSSSRSITLSPGLTVNLVAQNTSGAPTTITVANNAATLASALSSFAGYYNAAVDALAQYHGKSGGALEGDSLLQTLSGALAQLGNYNNGSPASALANYGITVDQSGQLSVDTSAITAAGSNLPALLSALGDASSGGFLQTATNLLNGIEDPSIGALKNEESFIARQISTQQSTIDSEQARVTQLQTNLTKQISNADSTIANLESQVSYVTGLFASYTGANSTQSNGLQTL
ncbi:MAG: flagellar filament capping protein FliD [Acidobacteriota bacterium]|nr:flagellar filament capping protein FliD [Acidobacteriota bacterium]